MRTHLFILFTLVGLLMTPTQHANAAPTPVAKGILVALGTTGGAAVSGAALGGVGIAIGSSSCGPEPECWSPLFGLVTGGAIGVIGGSVGGALLSAKALKVHQKPMARNVMIMTGASLAVTLIGTQSAPVGILGLSGMVVGLPMVAGLTATKIARNSSATAVSTLRLSPLLRREQRGLVATIVF